MLRLRHSRLLGRIKGPFNGIRTSIVHFSDNSNSVGNKLTAEANGGIHAGDGIPGNDLPAKPLSDQPSEQASTKQEDSTNKSNESTHRPVRSGFINNIRDRYHNFIVDWTEMEMSMAPRNDVTGHVYSVYTTEK